jgi:hypothetical protein
MHSFGVDGNLIFAANWLSAFSWQVPIAWI